MPFVLSFANYANSHYLTYPEIPGNLSSMRTVLTAQSKLECVYSTAFKSRYAWKEIIELKGFNGI